MATLNIELAYTVVVTEQLELPEDITADQVADVHVKWDEVFVSLKDGTELTLQLDSSPSEYYDFKRPDEIDWNVEEEECEAA